MEKHRIFLWLFSHRCDKIHLQHMLIHKNLRVLNFKKIKKTIIKRISKHIQKVRVEQENPN